MKKTYFLSFAILIIIIFLLAFNAPVQVSAQTATYTPEPTPVPNHIDVIEVGEDEFHVDHTITYGEIAVVTTALAILTVLLIYATFKVTTHYLR